MNVNSVNKVNVKSKVKSSYISRSVNDEFSLTDDEINSFKETLVLSSIDSLSKLVLNNPLLYCLHRLYEGIIIELR